MGIGRLAESGGCRHRHQRARHRGDGEPRAHGRRTTNSECPPDRAARPRGTRAGQDARRRRQDGRAHAYPRRRAHRDRRWQQRQVGHRRAHTEQGDRRAQSQDVRVRRRADHQRARVGSRERSRAPGATDGNARRSCGASVARSTRRRRCNGGRVARSAWRRRRPQTARAPRRHRRRSRAPHRDHRSGIARAVGLRSERERTHARVRSSPRAARRRRSPGASGGYRRRAGRRARSSPEHHGCT